MTRGKEEDAKKCPGLKRILEPLPSPAMRSFQARQRWAPWNGIRPVLHGGEASAEGGGLPG